MESSSPRRFALAAVCAAFAVVASACERAPTTAPTLVPSSEGAKARRIVPASSTTVDLVCALVEPERVAAIPEQAIEYSTLHAGASGFEPAPRFAAYLAEPILGLQPDLVVICPWQSKDTTERLREAGVLVHAIAEINTYADARARLLELGDLLGVRARADEVVRGLDLRVERLEQGNAARSSLRAMCYSNFGAQGWSAGSRTTVDEIMRLAGLRNVIAERGQQGHVTISFEELIALDPDCILVGRPLAMAAGSAGDRGGASEALLYAEPSLADLRAVRDRRIVSLPAWLFATGSHEIVTGAEELALEVDRMLAREPASQGPKR